MSNSSSSGTIKTTPAVTDTYKANRYEVEKQTPSNDTKALQTSLNDFGYVGKDNKPLKVDGAYGPNTDHAFNTAWKNNEQVIKNNELAKARDKVAEAINNAYEPLMDDAEARKWNMSKADIEKTQNLLNDFGYTDWQGNKLKVDGILGPKTRGALEKHIQDGTPKQAVLDMQKLFNEMGITDKDGNTLKPDGKLSVKTDSATHKAVTQFGNVKEQEPVRGDAKKSAQQTDFFKQALATTRNVVKASQEPKPASYYDYTKLGYDDVITNKQLEQLSDTDIDTIGKNLQSLYGNNLKTKDEIARAFNIYAAVLDTDFNETVEKLASDTFSADDGLKAKVTEVYENYQPVEKYEATPLSNHTNKDPITESPMWREHTLLEKSKNGTLFEPIENSKNQYPNDTVHLNDYFWKSGYKTADIEGAKDVLSSQKGVYLEDNGNIDDNTAVAIVNYAKANNLTLEQASDRLVELGRMYNEVENLGLSGEEIKQLQTKLNNLGITDGKGNKLAQDTWLGENTLTAIEKYSKRNKMTIDHATKMLCNNDEYFLKAYENSLNNNAMIRNVNVKPLEFKNKPLKEAEFKNHKKDNEPVLNFRLSGGVGLGTEISFKGVGSVEIGGKMYYNFIDNTSDTLTQNLELSAIAQAGNKVRLGGTITGTIEAGTKNHLKNEGFAGISIGNFVLGWDDLPENEDFIISVSGGGYLIVGGEIELGFNVSELIRRILDK